MSHNLEDLVGIVEAWWKSQNRSVNLEFIRYNNPSHGASLCIGLWLP
ncbi:MAG: hypothetical protein VKL98_00915 [Cyanobacteriota bacterium]|nr:hypothetical protein [Cyanobacteriota bacterium]